jgi:hypothetical protein
MTTVRREAMRGPVFTASGELHVAELSRIFDEVLLGAWAGGQTVVLDISGVKHWSVPAQAMVLGIARELAARRSSLMLVGASLRLRLQSQRLDVFTKVQELAAAVSSGGSYSTD